MIHCTLGLKLKMKFLSKNINFDKILLSDISDIFAPKLEYFNLNKYEMFEFLGKNVRVGTVCTVKIVNFMQGSSQVVDWYANGNATAIFLGKFLVESILQLTHSYAHFGRKNIRVAEENQSLREMNSFLPN